MAVTVQQVFEELRRLAPVELACSWDNVGLLVDAGRPVTRIATALDITPAVVEEAAGRGCELIVAHHPVIFHPLKTLSAGDVPARLLAAGISGICMHTNLDAAEGGVNDALARALGLEQVGPVSEDGIGRTGVISGAPSAEVFAAQVKKLLGANGVRFVDGGRPVRKVAVGGGACGDMGPLASACGCDTFVTSDVKYHEFQEAEALGYEDGYTAQKSDGKLYVDGFDSEAAARYHLEGLTDCRIMN